MAISATEACGYIHPGDIAHRLFNGNKYFDPAEVMTIWEDDKGVAAFTVTWPDRLNRTGLFEPVGTHKDHRRRGSGRAVVLYGMRQMAAEEMEFATVVNESNNEACGELYKACGFKPWYELDGYSKSVSLSHADRM